MKWKTINNSINCCARALIIYFYILILIVQCAVDCRAVAAAAALLQQSRCQRWVENTICSLIGHWHDSFSSNVCLCFSFFCFFLRRKINWPAFTQRVYVIWKRNDKNRSFFHSVQFYFYLVYFWWASTRMETYFMETKKRNSLVVRSHWVVFAFFFLSFILSAVAVELLLSLLWQNTDRHTHTTWQCQT